MCKDSLNIELWDTETTNRFIELNDVRNQGVEQNKIYNIPISMDI